MKNNPKTRNLQESEKTNPNDPEKRKLKMNKDGWVESRKLRNPEIGRTPATRRRSIPIREVLGVLTDPFRFLLQSAKSWKPAYVLCLNSSANGRNSSAQTAKRKHRARFQILCVSSSHQIRSSTASCRSLTNEKTERVGKKIPRGTGGFFV